MVEKIKEELKEMIQEILETDSEIADDANLVDDLGIDSVIILQLIANIETRFDVIFDDDDLLVEAFEDVSSVADYIKDLMER